MSARTFHRLACSPWRLTPRCPPRQSPPLHSDHEIEHLTEPWLEMVVLDQLCEELRNNNIYILDPRAELARASSPASSMETPAPAEEARAASPAADDVVADVLEADAPKTDAPASADSEADTDTRPRAAAAWAAGLWSSGGAPPSEAELDGALRARARRLARGLVPQSHLVSTE